MQRLRREVTRNPKKAAILGLLAVVALYFWAPLVWGWIASDRPAEEASATEAADDGLGPPALPNAGATPPTPSDEEKSPAYPWVQLDKWITQDPVSKAARLAGRRDPFRAVDVRREAEMARNSRLLGPTVSPESLGIALSATVVGPGRRVAFIQGKAYKEGDIIQLGGHEPPVEFTLAKVYPRSILLQRQGKQFELAIPRREPSGRFELNVNPK